MAFRASNAYIRERILSFGGAGLGKSFDFYCVMERHIRTKSDAEFHIMDSDESAHIMMSDPRFRDASGQPLFYTPEGLLLPQIHLHQIGDWTTLMAATNHIASHSKPSDWTLIDMIGPSYDWAQGDYTTRTYGKSLEDYYIERRQAKLKENKKSGFGSFEGIDWNIIKPIFANFKESVVRWPTHLYAVTGVKAIDSERADKDVKLMFGPHGVVPVGHKEIAHWFSTVIWKMSTTSDVWKAITIKDRSRVKFEGQPIEDFSRDYLMNVAGWKPL